jgi:hypothetical protein
MNARYKPGFFFVPLLLIAGGYSFLFQKPVTHQPVPSPTPTYDPLAEPLLPLNPTELDLGRNLYWHWCMPCHGDRGQGLTDEFRGIWEADHQNCWGRGCHASGQEGEVFPIPTIVPALVNLDSLANFSSVQSLADYLQKTHPPQSPGILMPHEYHAIALFVFAMNNRTQAASTTVADFSSAPDATLFVTQPPPVGSSPFLFGLAIMLLFVLILVFLKSRLEGTKK